MSFGVMLAELAGVDMEEARRREASHNDHSAAAESFSDMIDRKRGVVDRIIANDASAQIKDQRTEHDLRRGSKREEVSEVRERSSVEPQDHQDAARSRGERFRSLEGTKPRASRDEGLEM